jgi:hypothetical protein
MDGEEQIQLPPYLPTMEVFNPYVDVVSSPSIEEPPVYTESDVEWGQNFSPEPTVSGWGEHFVSHWNYTDDDNMTTLSDDGVTTSISKVTLLSIGVTVTAAFLPKPKLVIPIIAAALLIDNYFPVDIASNFYSRCKNGAYQWWRGDYIPELVEAHGGNVLDELSFAHELEDGWDSEQPLLLTRSGRTSFAARVANECKTALPLNRRSEANYLVAKDWCYKRMREHGMRPTHIVQVLPLAVSACFVHNVYEIEARQIESSTAIVENERLYEQTWYSWEAPSFFHPFGRKVRAAAYAAA